MSFGTRPEAIKLAPIILELQNQAKIHELEPIICVTGQHRQMLDQVLDLFNITPDYDLDVMAHKQTPTQVAAVVLAKLEPILQAEQPDWVLVQGDTTTVMAASLAAFYARVKVGHVEAGLRTWDKWQPFPEEINRKVAGVVSDMHFAPTATSYDNLLREDISSEQIMITGNPVIDALYWVADQPPSPDITTFLQECGLEDTNQKVIFVTAHRRENFGRPFENICLALHDISKQYGNQIRIVYPVHMNPNVWEPAHSMLGDLPNITLMPPVDYQNLVALLQRARPGINRFRGHPRGSARSWQTSPGLAGSDRTPRSRFSRYCQTCGD